MTRSRVVTAVAVALALACKLEPGGRCTGDGDCQPGLRCGADGLCVVETGKDLGASCAVDQDCVAWGTCQGNVCVLSADACVASGDCPAWKTCTDHACVQVAGKCGWDPDCASWQVCRTSSATCVSAPGRCDTATAKTDCQAWQACDAANHACVTAPGKCATSVDCAAWEACGATTHVCAPLAGRCNVAADCQSWQTCDTAGHACVTAPGYCAADADCATLQTCGAAHVCADPDGSGVLLFGGLQAPCSDALATLTVPSRPAVGFGCTVMDALVDPSGAVVYRDGSAPQRLWRFVPDVLAWDATGLRWTYPATPLDNDVAVATPNCTGSAIARWTMTAGGEVLHSCTVGFWYDAAGVERLAEPGGYELLAWATGDAKLLAGGSGLVVLDAASVEHAVDLAGSIAYTTAIARTNGTDFWLALFDATGAGELWSITSAGAATRTGAYPAPPTGLTQTGPVVLDRAGAAYVGMDVTKVVKRVAGTAMSTVAYDAASAPSGANDWTAQTASWWVLPSTVSLVTGP